MNLFRLAGDMTHLLSIVVLFRKIRTTKSCAGVSLKTQEMYVMVFLTRYIDLFTTYYSFYNILMKLFFIGTSVAIVWYMRFHKVVKQTYNKDQDTFKHYYLVLACFVLALLIPHNYTVMEVLWTFSIYLEAVLILPQLVLLQTSSNIDNLTVNYVFFLGAYRALYLLNWIYRFFTELHRIRWIPWISGLVQTALYADFFYYYIKSWRKQEELRIPA
ncbi:ER lumen protein-retaining receptor [Ziziphus jujuba]|uniref:ER lumen protein-retaining receptor n=1 Tax=Ziziphus jujuba TaxID=326968 RepID=A0ABM3ICD3_ZIZJJ|nr:ER lumen protein-retaining receptor [Ziziphus jujuba]